MYIFKMLLNVLFKKNAIEVKQKKKTLCPYHHGSAYYGQGAREHEH